MMRIYGVSFLFVVLMVAGWGSLDFFLDVPHTMLAIGILVAPFFFPVSELNGTKRGQEQGESRFQLLVLALSSTIGTGFLLPFLSGHRISVIPLPEAFRYLGILVCIAGYAVRVMAIRTLKRQFSYFVTIQKDHQLITTGIYSSIRHPIYLGVILLTTGLFLVFTSWYGFLFILFYSILLTHRMNQEEKLLLKYFGTVYQEYSSKSFRLIPHIY